MNYFHSTFISSTFWTERIGSAAGLKTLEIMEKTKSWEIISKIGFGIKKKWEYLSKKHKIKMSIMGLNALPIFKFENDNLLYKTFISQELLKRRILAGNSIYVCLEHKKQILDKYFNILDYIFFRIKNL